MESKKNDKCLRKAANSTTISSSNTSLLHSYLQDCQQQPPSPASSSTSQTTGDTTFEPSIDMMVNDFDDEQTLTEEEALAELEAKDPADEIETLHKESEMPLEMLLAHYRQQDYREPVPVAQKRHKRKKSGKKNKQSRSKHQYHQHQHSPSKSKKSVASSSLKSSQSDGNSESIDEIIVIEESEDEVEILKVEQADTDAGGDGEDEVNDDGDDDEEAEFEDYTLEKTKLTPLALLYPDKYAHIHDKMDEDCSDDYDDDDDYVKKTIMVGSAYQASIPIGLSKYGDVLPYENEDKLIWEPSQVSEQEVEDYLIRVKELKSSPNLSTQDDEIPSSSASVTSESDGSNTVKDDEQALHLLVQCGYNFKEALRRRRLNAVPLTGTMSLWSEEECRNFEEGIQKFGKDFRKIRQLQVRTRSIRELVQFYYLWKKTERHDQDFVDSDTIDVMDAYLDFDERDTNGTAAKPTSSSSCILSSDSYGIAQDQPPKRHLGNFSIMNETSSSVHPKKTKKSHRRRSSSSLLSGTKSKHHHDTTSSSSIVFDKTSSSEPASASASTKTWRNNSSSPLSTHNSSAESSSSSPPLFLTSTNNPKQK